MRQAWAARQRSRAVRWVLLAALLALLVWVPEVVFVAVTVAGAVAVWLASQPVMAAFAAGLFVGWRLTRRMRGWAT